MRLQVFTILPPKVKVRWNGRTLTWNVWVPGRKEPIGVYEWNTAILVADIITRPNKPGGAGEYASLVRAARETGL